MVKSGFYIMMDGLLKLTALAVKPVLFQHLTDIIFRQFLQDHFQTDYISQ